MITWPGAHRLVDSSSCFAFGFSSGGFLSPEQFLRQAGSQRLLDRHAVLYTPHLSAHVGGGQRLSKRGIAGGSELTCS